MYAWIAKHAEGVWHDRFQRCGLTAIGIEACTEVNISFFVNDLFLGHTHLFTMLPASSAYLHNGHTKTWSSEVLSAAHRTVKCH